MDNIYTTLTWNNFTIYDDHPHHVTSRGWEEGEREGGKERERERDEQIFPTVETVGIKQIYCLKLLSFNFLIYYDLTAANQARHPWIHLLRGRFHHDQTFCHGTSGSRWSLWKFTRSHYCFSKSVNMVMVDAWLLVQENFLYLHAVDYIALFYLCWLVLCHTYLHRC